MANKGGEKTVFSIIYCLHLDRTVLLIVDQKVCVTNTYISIHRLYTYRLFWFNGWGAAQANVKSIVTIKRHSEVKSK